MTLDRFFNPRAIAVIGASADGESVSGRPLRILVQHGYQGGLYPVNPKYRELYGRAVYPRIGAVPEPVDLALVAVPARSVPGVLEECSQTGVAHAMVFSSGFAESGDGGQRLQRQLGEIARRSTMRICGPNCEGMFNVSSGVPAGFSPAIDPDRGWRGATAGPIAIVAQSGGLGFALFNRGLELGLGFSKIVTTGNEVDLTWLDYVDYLVDDPETRVILGFLESLRHPRKLIDVARKAAERQKPIIVAKMGRSHAAGRAAVSHTGSMVGSDDAYDAAFRQLGLIRVDDIDEMLDAAAYFSAGRLPKGPRVGIVTASGGAGVWLADACSSRGLHVLDLDEPTREQIRGFIPAYGSASNPVDVTAQTVVEGGLERALELVAGSDRCDSVVAITTLAGDHYFKQFLPNLLRTLDRTDKAIVYFSYTSPTPDSARILHELSVPLFLSPARAARALDWGWRYRAFLDQHHQIAVLNGVPGGALQAHSAFPGRALAEWEARELLRPCGIPSPREGLAKSAYEAEQIFVEMGGPVALKVQAPNLSHKTDAGGVRLNLNDRLSVRRAYDDIVSTVRLRRSDARVQGVLVQRMVEGGVELILGARFEPELGPMVMLGIGGVYVELLRDFALRLAPVSMAEVSGMVSELKGSLLLLAAPGGWTADLEALENAIARFSEFVVSLPRNVREIEINPLVVLPEGQGVVMVDAAVHVSQGVTQ